MADILMTHPKIAKPGRASREAFDTVYQFKGWVLVDSDSMTRDELVSLSAKLGVDVPDSWTKALIVENLKDMLSNG
jgi:hypothetical protein